MVYDGINEVIEMFKNSFPVSFLVFLPLVILMSPVNASHDFNVYRMQQYDLQGVYHGCRTALMSVEARPISASSFTRKCVVTKLYELTIDKYKSIIQANAGGLLVILPKKLNEADVKLQEHLLELEEDLMEEETQLPIYFTFESPELLQVYDDITMSASAEGTGTAVEAILSSVTSSGFQLVVSGSPQKSLNDFEIINIHGKLVGNGVEDQLPTIAIVAHYDAYGIAPSLSYGADANGSGVVALLELARIFSRLYNQARNPAKYNIVFLLSGAGKFNYQGTKRWLEDQLESTEGSLLSDVSYVLCIDAIGSGNALHTHVSKPPKADSHGEILLQNMETSMKKYRSDAEYSMVHKKINLADDYLAWEHERFSIRRLPAFTLSHFDSYKDPRRNSILDTRGNVNDKTLSSNIQVIAESIARHIYALNDSGSSELLSDVHVNEEIISATLDRLTDEPRATQLFDRRSKLLTYLEKRLLENLKDVSNHSFRIDKRDPEVMFYTGTGYTMNVYSVKPAVFDLFLALSIASYLTVLYFVAQNFNLVYDVMKKLQPATTQTVQPAFASKHSNKKSH